MNLEWYIAHRLLKGDGTKSVSVPIVKIAIVGIALGLSVMLLSLLSLQDSSTKSRINCPVSRLI